MDNQLRQLYYEFNLLAQAKDKVAFLKDPNNVRIIERYNINREKLIHMWEWIAGMRTDDYRGL